MDSLYFVIIQYVDGKRKVIAWRSYELAKEFCKFELTDYRRSRSGITDVYLCSSVEEI